jgi:DNA replication protein DnaC
MSELISDRIIDNLGRLKMWHSAEALPILDKQARSESWSYLTFLDHLLEEEVVSRPPVFDLKIPVPIPR